MRELSPIEINVVSGGMDQVEIKGRKQSIDAQNGFTLSSISFLPISGGAALRIVGEGMGCAIAVNKAKKDPKLMNAATAASACTTLLRDTVETVDWSGWMGAVGNMQSAQSNALSHTAQKQNSR
jgi:hypothetical protein